MAAIAKPLPCPLNPNIVAPVSCWDHVSHRDFSPPLSRASTFDVNTSKSCGEFDLYLNKTRVKFEMTAIDSNFTLNPRAPAAAAFAASKSAALTADNGNGLAHPRRLTAEMTAFGR